MLLSLSIKNFTLVEQLHVDFQRGMTAITGETGTGKSLVLEALGFALGDRGDTGKIRAGRDRLDITAVFSVAENTAARHWLADHEFDEGDECIIRRTLSTEGRSRGFVNGQPVPMQQLQVLGDLMIDIHSQHEHQSLLLKETHRRLLDAFAGCEALTRQVSEGYREWQAAHRQLAAITENQREHEARREFLSFQVSEFEELALAAGELEDLERDQNLLANAEDILRDCHQILALCRDGDEGDAHSLLSRAHQLLQALPEKSPPLMEAESMLASALIQLDEASREVRRHVDSFEVNPERLQEIEQRLSQIYQLARKHKTTPDLLPERQRELEEELSQLSNSETRQEELAARLDLLDGELRTLEGRLTAARKKAAAAFAKGVNGQLAELGMASATLEVRLSPLEGHGAHGAEAVEFLVSTNPGQAAGSLSKIVSGGELSRISLAIQVIAARHTRIPTLVFDEVDVGVGGAVAEVIGHLLRDLGRHGQVICVTHLPQVASCAHQHMVASKTTDGKSTESALSRLEEVERVKEIARMLGGSKITDNTLDHAEEMLRLSAG